jgi:hypothetical protein
MYPKPNTKASFRKYKATKEAPFAIYPDSECSIDKHSKHVPIAFSYIVSTPEVERGFKPILRTFTKKSETHSVIQEVLTNLEKDCKNIRKEYFLNSIPINMT